jgi:hypothetical protein
MKKLLSIIPCSTLSHKQTKHTTIITVKNISFPTYFCLWDKKQYSTSLPLFSGKGKGRAIENILENDGNLSENSSQSEDRSNSNENEQIRISENFAQKLQEQEIYFSKIITCKSDNSGDLGGPSNTNIEETSAGPSNTNIQEDTPGPSNRNNTNLGFGSDYVNSIITGPNNISFDRRRMENEDYDSLKDYNAIDQDSIFNLNKTILDTKKKIESLSEPSDELDFIKSFIPGYLELQDNAEERILLREYLVNSENIPLPDVNDEAWEVVNDQIGNFTDERREGLSDYTREMLKKKTEIFSIIWINNDFNSEEINEGVQRHLEDTDLFPEDVSSSVDPSISESESRSEDQDQYSLDIFKEAKGLLFEDSSKTSKENLSDSKEKNSSETPEDIFSDSKDMFNESSLIDDYADTSCEPYNFMDDLY